MSAPAFVTDDGWRVEPMRIDYSDGFGPRRVIRVTRAGVFVGQCLSDKEVKALMGVEAFARLVVDTTG